MDFVGSVNSLGLSSQKNHQQNVHILKCLIRKLLSQKFTLYILVICSVLLTFNKINNSNSCNLTGDLKGQESAISSKCWNWDSNNIQENKNLTVNDNKRTKRLFSLHDHTNFILGLQALFFYMSIKFWSKFFKFLSVDIEPIEDTVYSDKSEFEYDEEELSKVVSSFDSYISSRKPLPTGKSHGNMYKLILIVLSKISFTVISFAQLFFLDYFIGNGSQLFGVEVLMKMWRGESLSEWFIFPHDTIFNFSYSDDKTDKQFSVHCDLAINQLNDKVFMFLWFWMLLVSIISLLDLISWIRKFLIILKQDSYTYMRNRVNIDDLTQPKNEEILLRQFVENYLGENIVFIFRLLSLRDVCVDLNVSEILSKLFDLFVTKHDQFLIDLKRVQEI